MHHNCPFLQLSNLELREHGHGSATGQVKGENHHPLPAGAAPKACAVLSGEYTAAANLLSDGANGSIIAWASNKLPTELHLLLGACDGLTRGFIHSRKVAPLSRRAHLPLSTLHLPCLTASYPLFSIPGTWSLCPIAMATSLTPGTPALRCSQALADTQADAEPLGKISFFSESCSKAVPRDPLGCWLSVSKLSIWRPSTTEQGWFISLLHELPGASNPNLIKS